jgi:hypothetical protein
MGRDFVTKRYLSARTKTPHRDSPLADDSLLVSIEKEPLHISPIQNRSQRGHSSPIQIKLSKVFHHLDSESDGLDKTPPKCSYSISKQKRRASAERVLNSSDIDQIVRVREQSDTSLHSYIKCDNEIEDFDVACWEYLNDGAMNDKSGSITTIKPTFDCDRASLKAHLRTRISKLLNE